MLDTTNSWMIFATLGLFHCIGNVFLTKDVFEYYPFRKQRMLLSMVVWLLPFAGALYVFRKIGIEHYKSNETTETGTAVGLLGMDEVFNPNAKPKYANEEMLDERNEFSRDWSHAAMEDLSVPKTPPAD